MKSIVLNVLLVALLVPLVFIVGVLRDQAVAGFIGALLALIGGVLVTCKLESLRHENCILRRHYTGSAL